MSNPIMAPWTGEQVERLNQWQTSGYVHPFTCGKRGDDGHQWWDGDLGTLLATKDGWVCRDCDYTQDWAHDFMFAETAYDD